MGYEALIGLSFSAFRRPTTLGAQVAIAPTE
jgi:hypothetical protein